MQCTESPTQCYELFFCSYDLRKPWNCAKTEARRVPIGNDRVVGTPASGQETVPYKQAVVFTRVDATPVCPDSLFL
jgi:hypothetical protein